MSYTSDMRFWCSKICALVLALVMMPGAFEVVENTTHLVREGHLAHVAATPDHHQPAGPEHGCTPTFHLCGCHVSLAFLGPQAPHLADPNAAGLASLPALDSLLTSFWPRFDRPPQV